MPLQMTPASPMPDIDGKDLRDCLEAAEYAADIFVFFRRLEPQVRIQPDYINQQVRTPHARVLSHKVASVIMHMSAGCVNHSHPLLLVVALPSTPTCPHHCVPFVELDTHRSLLCAAICITSDARSTCGLACRCAQQVQGVILCD